MNNTAHIFKYYIGQAALFVVWVITCLFNINPCSRTPWRDIMRQPSSSFVFLLYKTRLHFRPHTIQIHHWINQPTGNEKYQQPCMATTARCFPLRADTAVLSAPQVGLFVSPMVPHFGKAPQQQAVTVSNWNLKFRLELYIFPLHPGDWFPGIWAKPS